MNGGFFKLDEAVSQAAYASLEKSFPHLLQTLKDGLKNGMKADIIETRMIRKYGNGNSISNSVILAAYHIEEHPELLAEVKS